MFQIRIYLEHALKNIEVLIKRIEYLERHFNCSYSNLINSLKQIKTRLIELISTQ